jgi:hypothetical protein
LSISHAAMADQLADAVGNAAIRGPAEGLSGSVNPLAGGATKTSTAVVAGKALCARLGINPDQRDVLLNAIDVLRIYRSVLLSNE